MYIFRNCNRLPFSFFPQLTWATAQTARAVSVSNIPILSVKRFQRIGSVFQYLNFLVCGIFQHLRSTAIYIWLTQWHSGKEFACSAADPGLIPGLGRCPGGGHGNLLQYSCLDNPMDRGAWQAEAHSPGGTSGEELPANTGDLRRGFNPWVRKIPWRRAWQPAPAFLCGQSHGQRSVVGYSPQDFEESDTTEMTPHARTICIWST